MTAGFGTTAERLADETARLEWLRADLAETTRGPEEARLLGVISQRMHTAEHLLAQLILIGQFRGAEIPRPLAQQRIDEILAELKAASKSGDWPKTKGESE